MGGAPNNGGAPEKPSQEMSLSDLSKPEEL